VNIVGKVSGSGTGSKTIGIVVKVSFNLVLKDRAKVLPLILADSVSGKTKLMLCFCFFKVRVWSSRASRISLPYGHICLEQSTSPQ